ncbi:preprotein translocase subunit SecE [bacterium]|nr:preprotein translocase subunit SecE [bacterium]
MSKNIIIKYAIDSFHELKKVTWPTRNQALKLTAIVLGFSLFMALSIGIFDALFNSGYKYLLTLS